MLYINIHVHKACKLHQILEIQSLFHTQAGQINENPKQLFSIGIHPWHTFNINIEKEIRALKKTANCKNVIAIGECGLDKLKGNSLFEQTEIFKAQAIMANEIGKPLIIHCVKAFQEIVELHRQIKPVASWIIHNFTKNGNLALQLTELGFVLSFGLPIIDKDNAPDSFAAITNNAFFLETDEFEGQQIEKLYNKAAELKNMTVEQLSEIIKNNFERCFKVQTDEWQ